MPLRSINFVSIEKESSKKRKKGGKMEVKNKYIVIKHHIEDAPRESNFELKTGTIALSVAPGSDDIIVKNLYISMDPYHINRMKFSSSSQGTISFAAPIHPGQVIIHYFGFGNSILIGSLFGSISKFVYKIDDLKLYMP